MLGDDDEELFFGEDELDSSNIREVYKQFTNNARAYMLLRFRHFATFTAVTAFVGTAAYQVKSLEVFRMGFLVLGIIATLLFWLLDYRTAQYLSYYSHQSRAFERRLIPGPKLREELLSRIPSPRFRFISASNLTNIIFALILAGWVLLLASLVVAYICA